MRLPLIRRRLPTEAIAHGLIAVLLVWAFLRGYALAPEPYGLGQFFYTYEAGFLIRGLLGSLVTALAGPEPMAMYALIQPLTAGLYFTFVAALLYAWRRLREPVPSAAAGLDDLLFLAVLSGPLMIGIGATRGFLDTPSLLVGLLAYLALRDTRRGLSLLLMAAALLIHEQVAFSILPAMGWLVWNRLIPRRNGHAIRDIATLLAMCLMVVLVTHTGQGDAAQLALLTEKVRTALQTPYFDRWSDPYLTVFAAQNDTARNITLVNFERFYLRSHQVMLIPTLVFTGLGLMRLAAARRWVALPVLLIANLMPFAIILFAMDVHRYLFHAQLTSYLLLAETLRTTAHAPPLRLLIAPLLLGLTVWQITITDYDTVKFNARNATPLYEIVRTYGDPDTVPATRVGTPHI